ncbi:AAA family ATPase [Ignatzschineria sp. LJL83]
MINFIIKRLSINNFKSFDHIDLKIDSNNLIVLDGPNGFGKTSFFDALELLFTGNIRRYLELEDWIIDGRSPKTGCPWLYKQAKVDDSLSIKIELSINGAIHFFERIESKENLDKIRSLREVILPLYKLESFDSLERDKIKEDDYFTHLLGMEYKRDLELYHYVEQEENIRFLKAKEKDRQDRIAHLFDIKDVQDKINNITEIHKRLARLCNAQEKTNVEALKKNLDDAKKNIFEKKETIKYKKLIEVTDQIWDREVIDLNVQEFDQWFLSNGVLVTLKSFIQNLSEYEKDLYNKNLEEKIKKPEEVIKKMLQFSHRLTFKNEWRKDVQRFKAANALKDKFSNVNKALKDNTLVFPEILLVFLPQDISIIQFKEKVEYLHNCINTANALDMSIMNLLAFREEMLKAFDQCNQHIKPTGDCPACGYKWGNIQILTDQLDEQKMSLEQLATQQNQSLAQELQIFAEKYKEPIETLLNDFLLKEKDLISYKERLVSLTEQEISILLEYSQELDKAGIEYNDLYLEEYNLNVDIPSNVLSARIEAKFKEVDIRKLESNFDFIYTSIFQKNMEVIKKITLQEIDEKIKYIEQQKALAQSKYVAICEQKYKKAIDVYDKSQEYRKRLNRLKNIYEKEKEMYLESILREIEILFHIYSGRLMQNSKNGLGLFIENKGSLIAFHEVPGQEYDAVFSLSSGQLSALILSFTLALNKRYANHNLLFIDDPVQTLDEINIAGFIDLLRTEFKQYQLFISTHEDHISAYFRYKYLKYQMPADRINFMDIRQRSI